MNKMMQMAVGSLALSVALLAGGARGADPDSTVVDPQRPDTPLSGESPAPERYRVEVVEGGIPRSYKEQPPMIPHAIDKYEISLRLNSCLKCHSEETYKAEKAPKLGESHFLDRDGNRLPKVSMRRYFCTQCHAPQLNPPPLVDNTFQGRQ